jgi:hypothetical protein
MNFEDAFQELKNGAPITIPDRSIFLQWHRSKQTIMVTDPKGQRYDVRETASFEHALSFLFREDWELAQLPSQLEVETKVEQPHWWDVVNFEPDEPELIRRGDEGENVVLLQEALRKAGLSISVDGVFGSETETAVRQFQRRVGLSSDGVVGENTAEALAGKTPKGAITDADILWAARELGCEPAAILAVSEVESSGSGFFSNGKPKILFERHWMRRRLAHHGFDYRPHMRTQPNIVNTRTGGYKGGVSEYLRLEKAKLIHEPSALESASWGAYQIMGFHWDSLGYESAVEYAQQMHENGSAHLKAFVRFIQNDRRLVNAIRSKAWATFARIYNGPNYRKNQYDRKMRDNYIRQVNGGANSLS